MIGTAVIILGAPRSGTTMFYHTLARSSHLWSLGGESQEIIEGPFRPADRGWGQEGNVLTAADLDDRIRASLLEAFESRLHPGYYWRHRGARRERDGSGRTARARLSYLAARLRARRALSKPHLFLEKTPKNCLRIPMLESLFPKARYLFLRRDGRSTISSLMDGWRKPDRYNTYTLPEEMHIAGYDGAFWCFVLPPGWRNLLRLPLEHVCAAQWIACVNAVLDFLPELRAENRVYEVAYEELVENPRGSLLPLFDWLGIPFEEEILPEDGRLRVVNTTSPPSPDKWRERNGDAIERILPIIAESQVRLGYVT